jgi:hypothetical protein
MTLEPIVVSPNGRFLATQSGQPFFWLGDTAWELFHRLNRQETEAFLENRRQRGMNVIQAVILAEFDGLHAPNAYGHVPLLGDDPTRLNEPYFRHVDFVIRLAAEKGLYIGLLPTWGDKVNAMQWGTGPVIFNPENARVYGELLGRRYRSEPNLIWILGGDRDAAGFEPIWDAMAAGIAAGLGRRPLCSYHPMGGAGSSTWFHDSTWLDVNMWQSGHTQADAPNWEMIGADYRRLPARPVLDGEPCYEDHPIDPFTRAWQPAFGRFGDHDVRKAAYRAVFAGACGHTYGHHSVWQFASPARAPINHPMPYWDEAILRPGAAQLLHLKNLMLSRPYFERIPDQALLLSLPGDGPNHAQATRAAGGSYAFVYLPQANQAVQVDLSRLNRPVAAWWFDPRSAQVLPLEYYTAPTATFRTPPAGPDWVLVLDEAARAFPPPGHQS